MKWTVAKAREHFSELLREAASEPQPIYNRDRLVGAVVGVEALEEYRAVLERKKERTLAESFEGLRALLADEGYELHLPLREDRENAFPESLTGAAGGPS
jgi:hypothetical protein